MKIAIIGGGSTYTPELIDGCIAKGRQLGLEAIFLHDIDPQRLDIVGSFAKRMVAHSDASFKVVTTLDVREALEGARFVLTQIRVGGQEARHRDIQFCLRHGLIGQETTGIGGFAKALRTIPRILELCILTERYAPGAWMLNFTNPSGLITEAILKHTGVRALGLCNIPVEVKMLLARELEVDPSRIRLDYVGLNHLAWLRRVYLDGRDIMASLIQDLVAKGTPKNIPDFDYDPLLVDALGMVPMYYLRYYYSREKMYRLLKAQPKDRAQEVMEIEKNLFALYSDPAVHSKPDLLNQRGGAFYSVIAVELIEALSSREEVEHIVNIQNGDATPDLPPQAVIEAPALISSRGARPLPVGRLEPSIRGLIQIVKAYEELTIQAAIDNDYRAAFLAMTTHPLGPSPERAEQILDELLAVNSLHFPKKAVRPTREERGRLRDPSS